MARNILQMALPMTVAQLINILYNIVDRMYLGRLPGHLSLTGLGLCLPIISILMGFANLCGMGGAPLCSIHRGKGENEEAERILGNSFTLLLLFGGGLTVFCLAFRRPIQMCIRDRFEELCEFLREARIERAGIFQFSPEEGTPAAEMGDQVDAATAERRVELVVELQSRVMDAFNGERLGECLEVLCLSLIHI